MDVDIAVDDLEQLTDFLYLIPIGLIRFRQDGSIDLANPPVSQLLMPLMALDDLDNAYTSIGRLVPHLAERLRAGPPGCGLVIDHERHAATAGPRRIVLATTVHRIAAEVYVAVIEDVTAQAEQERQFAEARDDLVLRRHHDILTGLANRSLLEIQLAETVHVAEPPAALIFVDVIGAKAINETKGFAAGDALLVEIAQRLRAVAGPGNLVARLGGDHFAVLCGGIPEDAVEALGARVRLALGGPFDIGGQSCEVAVRVTVASVESRPAAA